MAAVLIEACVESANTARIATEAGADRIELNRALKLDGLTPTPMEARATVAAVSVPVIAMVRPHDQGFVYSRSELEIMTRDLQALLEVGVSGIAVGALTDQNEVDVPSMKRLLHAAEGRPVVFHRAFDVVADPVTALEVLVDLGVTRVLTSGQARTAAQGTGLIQHLVGRAAGRIEILPAAGVGPENASEIIKCTGCSQIHGSFRDAAGSFDPARLRGTRAALALRS